MSGLVVADVAALGTGAFLGALSRYQVGKIANDCIAKDPKRFGKLTGWHTAVLNVSGSFLLGAVYAVPTIETKTHSTTNTKITSQHPSWMNLIRDPWGRIQQGITPRTKLMWGVGFCGSYTTFSTFSYDVITWISQGHVSRAVSYVAINNVCSIGAAGLGMLAMKKILQHIIIK